MKLHLSAARTVPLHVLVGMLAFLLVCTGNSAGQTPDHVFEVGDQLLITVWGYTEFSGPTIVKSDGSATIPLIGEVSAAGLTKAAFIATLQRRLGEYIQGDTRITVSVVGAAGERVTIMGSVTRPGNYPIVKTINLLELISMAEGYVVDADLTHIMIYHKDKEQPTTEVNLESYLTRSDLEGIPKVQAGDVVLVPKYQNFVQEFSQFFRDVVLFFALFQLADQATK